MSESKKDKRQRIEEIRKQFRAVRAARRRDEIEDHNGKPFTSRNLPPVKTKYNRNRLKNRRDDY